VAVLAAQGRNPVGAGSSRRSGPRVARSSQPWALLRNPFGILRVTALAAGMTLLAGCIIPVDYHAPGSRHNVDSKTQTNFTAGVTTKEDVLRKLGEPDFVSEDGQRVGYAWTKVNAIWFVGSEAGMAGGTIDRSHLLEIVFDEKNTVSTARVINQWGPSPPLSEPSRKPEEALTMDLRLEAPRLPPAPGNAKEAKVAMKLLPVVDRRLERSRIGERFAALQVKMGDVYFSEPVPEYFETALAGSLRKSGFRLVESGEDRQMTAELTKFWVTTKATPLYCDIVAEVECDLGFNEGNPQALLQKRTCRGSAQRRTYVWPTAALMSKTLEQALDDLFQQIASIAEL
jgi:hypothetical protein